MWEKKINISPEILRSGRVYEIIHAPFEGVLKPADGMVPPMTEGTLCEFRLEYIAENGVAHFRNND
jgi:hypothetical protein